MSKALESCSVWTAKGKWESCKSLRISQGDQKLRNKHRMEKEKADKFSRLSKHPQFITVDGTFGDRWKDSVLPGVYKLDNTVKAEGLDGRPVYKKADNTDFYLNYYAKTKEWAFRSGAALGQWKNYAHLKVPIVSKSTRTFD